MAKRTELKCPICGQAQLKVRNCKEEEIECHSCGTSLLITKDEDGKCFISAYPKQYEGEPKPVTAN